MLIEHAIKYLAVAATGLLVAMAIAALWRRWAPRWGFVDHPGPRKIHRDPIPVAGGLAVFLAFHCVCAVVFLLPWKPFAGQISIEWWYRFIPLSAGVICLGLLDDRFPMKPIVKLAGQIVLAVSAYLLDIRVQNVLGRMLPGYVDFAATVIWFLLLMNSFNLIDGIDGLATGIAFIASIGIAISLVFRREPGDVLLFLGFAGACAGFLRHNFHPADIFLGDTGSLFLGFTLAALAISTSSKGPTMAAIGMPLLAVGVPLFDTLLAVWRRTVRNVLAGDGLSGALRGVDRADADHLHHRLLRGGRRHSQVALLLYGMTVALVVLGLLVSIFHDRAMGILALALLFGTYTVVRHLAWIELRDTGQAVLQGIARPVRRNFTLLFYVGFDLLVLGIALLLTLEFMRLLNIEAYPDLKRMWLRHAPLDVGLPFLFLIMFRSYSRVWYLARISEYLATGLAVVLGYGVACAIALTGAAASSAVGPWLIRYWLLVGLAVPLIVGVRGVRRVLEDLVQWAARSLRRDVDRGPRALLCGAGYRTTLFLRQVAFRGADYGAIDIVGLVDRDDATRGHYVHGLRVLGNLKELPRVLAEHPVDVVYIVEEMDGENEQKICAAVKKTKARLVRWTVQESEIGCSVTGSASEEVAQRAQDPV